MDGMEQRIAWHVDQARKSKDGLKFHRRMARRAIKLAREAFARSVAA